MTIQKHEEIVDAEVVEDDAPLSTADARALTDRIRVNLDGLWEMVIEAFKRGAHRALGYSSWDEYCEIEFGSNRIRLPREERREAVRSMREHGMSIRAVAAATNLGIGTIHREAAGVPNGTPASLGADGKTYSITRNEADEIARDTEASRESIRQAAREDLREFKEAQAAKSSRAASAPMSDAEKFTRAINIVGAGVRINHGIVEEDLNEDGWNLLRALGLR